MSCPLAHVCYRGLNGLCRDIVSGQFIARVIRFSPCDLNPVKVKAEEQLVVEFKNLAAV
jgi:hypothetical protein